MSTKPYLVVSGLVFGVVAVVHLARIVAEWPFVVGPFAMPVWVSWGGLFAAGTLSVWAFRLSRR
jgi:hypothetical protein